MALKSPFKVTSLPIHPKFPPVLSTYSDFCSDNASLRKCTLCFVCAIHTHTSKSKSLVNSDLQHVYAQIFGNLGRKSAAPPSDQHGDNSGSAQPDNGKDGGNGEPESAIGHAVSALQQEKGIKSPINLAETKKRGRPKKTVVPA